MEDLFDYLTINGGQFLLCIYAGMVSLIEIRVLVAPLKCTNEYLIINGK